jgi:hypothetical protein
MFKSLKILFLSFAAPFCVLLDLSNACYIPCSLIPVDFINYEFFITQSNACNVFWLMTTLSYAQITKKQLQSTQHIHAMQTNHHITTHKIHSTIIIPLNKTTNRYSYWPTHFQYYITAVTKCMLLHLCYWMSVTVNIIFVWLCNRHNTRQMFTWTALAVCCWW